MLLGLALLVLTGCSSTTFFYNRLDTFISWYVDDYVTLTPAQEADFDRRLGALLAWHRREELPQYVTYLEQVDVLLAEGDISAGDTEAIFDSFQGAADRLQVAVLNMMLDFAPTLSPDQRREFMCELKRSLEEQKEEYLSRSDEQFREDNIERIEDNLREFTGRLSKEQKALIRAGSKDFVRLDKHWLDERERWITALDAIVQNNPPDWMAKTREILTARGSHRSAEYAESFEHNVRVTRELLRQVINSRSPEQDRRLRRNLRDYSEDFLELIAEVEPPA